jgi:superfamily I DNA/RNA helicase
MQTAKLFGAAGVGKTSEIQRFLTEALSSPQVGGDPARLGFTTLTKIGRHEAASRVSAAWGVPQGYLEKEGFFRTTHSIAFRQLGISPGEIIGGGGKDDQEWFERHLGCPLAATFDEDGIPEFSGDPEYQACLMAWHIARATLKPLSRVLNELYQESAYTPAPGVVVGFVKRYEAAKARDGRLDFDDMLGRFSGITFTVDGPQEVPPEGDVPDRVVGWCFDEAQDASALLFHAQKRLLTGRAVQWCWICADPFQAVHTWNGADPSLFLNWQADKEKMLSKSFRCPPPMITLGERCLRRLGKDYIDRKVIPADHEGSLVREYDIEAALGGVAPSSDTLILARTNRHVRKVMAMLKDQGIPFRDVKNTDEPSNKAIARAAVLKLSAGECVPRESVGHVLHLFRPVAGDVRLWADGSRKAWKSSPPRADASFRLGDLKAIGATDNLLKAISDGTWTRFDEGGSGFVRTVKRWGEVVALKPKVRVGTVHASKGTESDHVVVCTGSSRPIYEQKEASKARYQEECRIEYTAVTRARRKLTIALDPDSRYAMDICDD